MAAIDWREHPGLQGRFHPEFPDDLQVIVHDGLPTRTGKRPELIWVQVTSREPDVTIFGKVLLPVFQGIVLNKPHAIETISAGITIRFVVPQSGPYPLHVTERYLEERTTWRILA